MYSALILAAGEGKRMNSSLPRFCMKYALKLNQMGLNAAERRAGKIIVVGNGAEEEKPVTI